jgi:hypothetical protein
MWHLNCEEGSRLLDSYVMALSICDSLGRDPDYDPLQAAKARTQLIAARRKYWFHIDHHQCRRPDLRIRRTVREDQRGVEIGA